jgi:hypothetical protein
MLNERFHINWKLKAFAFNVLDRMFAGDKLYYLLQRHVTKAYPRVLSPTKDTGAAPIFHAKKFKEYGVDLTKAHLMEFGAGWDLYNNITMYCMGVNRQYLVDVRRWAKAEAVNAVIRHLQTDPPDGAIRIPDRLIRNAHLENDLSKCYGISYNAPADARTLPVEDATFDVIATTTTLEHIPEDILHGIMKECTRVLRSQGLMSHLIDYSDHYANSDPDINEFNYLRFDERQWKKFNPSIHFQNRFRTPFYVKLFKDSGFEIVEYSTWKGACECLEKTPVSRAFRNLSFEELRELGGNYLLRKP